MSWVNRNHNPALDGVRGLAILLVILFHSTFIPRIAWIDKVWHSFAFGGWAGVDLFFVLSGFLITQILIREKNTSGYFINFYARRALRIFPLYYLFLFFTFYVFPQPVNFGFTYWTFLSNVLISRMGHFQSPILDVTWSLALEEQFYLIWPFLIWCFTSEQMKKLCIVLFVSALSFRLWNYFSQVNALVNYVLLPSRMDSLCAGAWLAFSKGDLPFGFCKKALGLMIPLAGSVFLFDVSHSAPLIQTVGFSLNALLGFFLIGSLLNQETTFLQRFFRHSFLKTCGKYSYAMYLVHVPVTRWILNAGKGFWDTAGTRLGAGFPIQILFHAAVIGGTLLMAFLAFQIYEKHFLKWKKYFGADLEMDNSSGLAARL